MHSDRIKHLEFITAAISRLNGNAFQSKAWCVAIVAALFSIKGTSDRWNTVVIAGFTACLFWLIDGYYMSLERQFVALFKHVASEPGESDFSMNIKPFNKGREAWPYSMLSVSMIMYPGVIILCIFVFFFVSSPS